MPSEMTMLSGRPWWKTLLKSPRITALFHHRQEWQESNNITTTFQRILHQHIGKGQCICHFWITSLQRSMKSSWCHYQASRLSSLSQLNGIALATRILWIMFIWSLRGLAHRPQIIVLAYRKAWPVDGGKIDVDPCALLWWHGHRFGRVQPRSEQMEVPQVHQGANRFSPTDVGRISRCS